MRITARIWLIVAGVLIVSGLIAGLTGFAMLGFDFNKINTAGKKVENEHMIEESIKNIDINVGTSDIVFEAAKDGKIRVVCNETEKVQHNVKVENGTLRITMKDDRQWYNRIFNFGTGSDNKIVIYLPEDMEFDDVRIDTSTGDLIMNNRNINGNLKIDSSTGKITLDNIKAGTLKIDTSTGDIKLNKVLVSGNMKIDSSTGDVRFTSGDAESVDIDTSTGDIYCSFLSEKNVKADTSTGKIDASQGGSGGACKLDSSTGDITVKYE